VSVVPQGGFVKSPQSWEGWVEKSVSKPVAFLKYTRRCSVCQVRCAHVVLVERPVMCKPVRG